MSSTSKKKTNILFLVNADQLYISADFVDRKERAMISGHLKDQESIFIERHNY